jgi:hypothetical protein
MLSSVDCITTTSESEFLVHTAVSGDEVLRADFAARNALSAIGIGKVEPREPEQPSLDQYITKGDAV